jgi:hypothetical protein
MSRPDPRPALQRSGDGSVHPAAPRVVAEQHIHPVPHAPSAAKQPKKNKGVKPIDRADDTTKVEAVPLPTYEGKTVDLTVAVPKDLRKQVRKAADKAGTPIDTVVIEALTRFVAGRS